MKRYICSCCGYIYDPAVGDPLSGVPAGTLFEKLAGEWSCPLCYAAKSAFDEME